MTFNEDEDTKLSPEEAVAKVKAEEETRLQILSGLAKKIEDELSDRANKRVAKDAEWEHCLRLYHSPLNDSDSYYSDRPFDTKPARKRPVPNIVRTKCDTAVANSVSMQFAAGEKNWDMWPPANNVDPAVSQSCRLMEKEIQTQLDACKYPMHARRAIEDRVILGTGVIKGPVNTGKLRTKYVKSGDIWVPKLVEDKTPAIEYVPVWRFYPDMTVSSHAESASDIEIHPMTALELSQLTNNSGFDPDAIKAILSREDGTITAEGYNTTYLNKIQASVWSSPYMYKDRYTVIEYHGPITYDEVEKMGLVPNYESPTQEYYGEVWVCCGKIIRMELENIEGAFETPYAVAVWKRDPSSPFGYGHPLLLADSQRVVTQAYHMILDNASLTSGPQISMYQEYIQPADGNWTIGPNKVWLLTDPAVKISDAISFFTPTNVIGNILPVLQLARQFAEEESATTAMAAGLGSPQNMESATGQLMMQQNSTTLLDFLAEEWDDQVTEKMIRRMYAWNMQYNPKDYIKGDYMIDVKSSSEYKNKQTHIRDLERLSVEASQNEALGMWVNQDELQRARLALMHLPSNKIIRTEEEYQQAVQAKQQQPDPSMIEMQLKMAEAQREDRRLALEEAQLQYEMRQAQQREQWEHEEKMGSNYARAQEAQAQVIKARAEVDVEMLKLAAKDKQLLAKMQNDRLLKENDTQAKVFMEGMRQNQKAIDQQLTQEELEIKKTQGTGI